MDHIHLIGIGGSGLSAIARLLLEMGFTVSGSDHLDSAFLADLRIQGADIKIGHHSENIVGANLVVRSSAIADDNPEIKAAREAGIPVLKRADFLGNLMDGKTGIAVAGTHGKTTTTAMLAWVLTALKQDPSFIVGGIMSNLGVNARAGKGTCFVIEADEYDRMFLGLKPMYEVITNVEHDHPDCYPTPQIFYAAFENFVDLLPADGTLVACGQDAGTTKLISHARTKNTRTATYGLDDNAVQKPGADFYSQAGNLSYNAKGGFSFDAILNRRIYQVNLQVPGIHNVLNALAVLTVIDLLHLPLDQAALALGDFQGTRRRFEMRGEPGGITIIDDYAHHPTEIRATLAAARARYPGRRIWVVWQPHTYSRTQLLQSEFSQSFLDADHVIVTEIYAAREQKQDFSSSQVVKAMGHMAVQFIPELPDVSDYLINHLNIGDVLLVLSAGDADQISTQVLHHYEHSEEKHV
ncbi:MAG: UDP-N-acetylmuramate--L-alanine ligase [Chloroflexi bacterium GWB2_49_20]|nr:MAG: UDP-N-acetylmuramate--L-alanine ligase [Chloroflexi bacterium GWB2_49_20]OGN76148.1 MAG: UDP-N-acetylmuramate--L-alanine ligase [Chloroflexi bacterium GWC2_49_37]OGN83534.1 MAG: UDP-N-acetylmuramate--L-alanine ligase [Chloroflexi bacterium GWD2_49_16]HBG73921.1 UDP-N-acetylmuramate--L-alanine ligase [Anaerolineae bacterium]HCM96151.1 UDP-N-acetylmuramate--L-alanine ligase [Anaerolineae bacterium]